MSLLFPVLWIALLSFRVRRVKARPRFKFRRDDGSSSSDSDSDSDCNRVCRMRRRKPRRPRLSNGALAGIVIGVVVFLIFFFLILWIWRRRQRQKKIQEKTARMEGVRRTDDPLSPVLPPKDRDTRTSSNLIVPTSLVPSSPPGRNFSSIRYEQSLSSPAGTDLAFMRSLERPNSQHSADYIPHERTDGNFTSMGNLGRTQFQCLAGPSPHATTGGNIISMQNLGHAQSQRSSPLELMDPLPNPHDTPSSATSTHASNSLLYGSSTRRTSTLHEDMTMYQKKLEMHDQEEAQIAREAQVDPPPQYGA